MEVPRGAGAGMATQDEIASHLSVGQRHVRKLLSRGVLPYSKKARGGLDLDACRMAYISYLRSVAEQYQSKDGTPDLATARACLARAQTEMVQLRNAEFRAEHLPAEMVESHWAEQVAADKARIRELPDQIHAVIQHLTAEEMETLRHLVERSLGDLVEGSPPTQNARIGRRTP